MRNRWHAKPEGMAGAGVRARILPMALAAYAQSGFHATRVPVGTIGRPEGRGGGTG